MKKRITFYSSEGTIYSLIMIFPDDYVIEDGIYNYPFKTDEPVYGIYESVSQDDEFPLQFYHDDGISRIKIDSDIETMPM